MTSGQSILHQDAGVACNETSPLHFTLTQVLFSPGFQRAPPGEIRCFSVEQN